MIIGFLEVATPAPRPQAVSLGQILFHFDSQGKVLARLGRFSESERFIQLVQQKYGVVAYWDLAFGKRFAVAAYPGGFLGGDGEEPVIRQYTPGGKASVIHRVPFEVMPVTKGDIDQYRKDVLARTPPDQRTVFEAMLNTMPYPRTRPAFKSLIADDDDRIWVQQYPNPGARTTTWLVLNPSTRTSTVFVGPSDFELLDVSRDTACGVSRGALDVESIRCFKLLTR